MKICSQYLNTSFGAKNKRIRDADHIMRTAKKQFPIVSSSYIDTFYSDSSQNKIKLRNSVSEKIADLIEHVRDIYLSDYPAMYDSSIETVPGLDLNTILLQCLKKHKVGNCSENASLAVAALTANGIDDAKKCYLYLNTYFINKQDRSILYKSSTPLDHSFAMTSMGKHSRNIKDLIVVDPWLGFADSATNAVAKYKQYLCPTEKIAEIQQAEDIIFRNSMKQKGIELSPDDYEIKSNIHFFEFDLTTKEQSKNLERYLKLKYPNIVVKQD